METIGVLITHLVNSYLEKQLDNRFILHRMWNFTHTDELIKHHSGSIRAIVTCPNFITDRHFIDLFPALEIVPTFSVGVNHVDLAYCKQKGIRVTNTPEANTVVDVADLAIGMILTMLRRINESDRFVRSGLWKKCVFFKLTTKHTSPNPCIYSSMAAQELTHLHEHHQQSFEDLIRSYLGVSFAIFLGFLPKQSISLIPSLQTHNESLSKKLLQAEEHLEQLYSRRKEDSKANARVVEIFASHRHGWQQEEKRLLRQIDDSADEIVNLRAKIEDLEIRVDELKREVSERDELLNFMTNREDDDSGEYDGDGDGGGGGDGEFYGEMLGSKFGKLRVSDEGINHNLKHNSVMGNYYMERGIHNVDDLGSIYDGGNNKFNLSEFSNSGVSKFLAERSNLWQGVPYESVEPVHDLKHYVTRRESPWKVDGDSSGVSVKLKLLEQELQNLENIGANDLSKVPSLMKKQAKRYQALAGKIDDLCRRMQENDPCEPKAGLEFRTQRQTEFLLEALRLQQRASETGQRLMSLQTETGTGCNYGNDLAEGRARLTTRFSLNSIRNNFRDIQRNLEIWLARIIGDVEGILARDGASRVNEYYMPPRYPFVQQERF